MDTERQDFMRGFIFIVSIIVLILLGFSYRDLTEKMKLVEKLNSNTYNKILKITEIECSEDKYIVDIGVTKLYLKNKVNIGDIININIKISEDYKGNIIKEEGIIKVENRESTELYKHENKKNKHKMNEELKELKKTKRVFQVVFSLVLIIIILELAGWIGWLI